MILRHFTPEAAAASRLTIVSDPDRLLAEQSVLESVRQRGFALVPFDDPVAFRYAYESGYRQHWEQGTPTSLVVVLRSERGDTGTLPYDLVRTAARHGRMLRFGLPEIFPGLASSIVNQLDRSDFDQIHEAIERERPERLGENATKDFLLRTVFGIAPEVMTTTVDLLRYMLRRHFRNRQMPPVLDDRLVDRLEAMNRYPDWPLRTIIGDRLAFFAFLEERWPAFVREQVGGGATKQLREPKAAYGLRIPGPTNIPFDHDDIRVFIDNLFVEGFLSPTDAVPRSAVEGTWLAWGVRGEPERDDRQRFTKLTAAVTSQKPDAGKTYRDWVEFARLWAEWSALRAEVGGDAVDLAQAEALWHSVNAAFTDWMNAHYGSLHNVAYLPQPVMVHHVVRFMAHGWRQGQTTRKLALLVVDGLSWSQWIPLRDALGASAGQPLAMREDGVFAWVPTLTPVSRQAIFAADPPLYFPHSIGTTAKDENHWRRFWQDRGLHGSAVQFVRPARQETATAFLERLVSASEHPATRVLATVVPTIDEMVHGTPTGARGLHAQVRHWAGEGHLAASVRALVDRGFDVYLTSDHGNVECTGIGKPNVGEVAGERGERVHVFEDDLVRDDIHTRYPGTLPWAPIGLPVRYLPLLAGGRGAFIGEGKLTVAHGGISLEEVVVPFVTIGALE
jgi:hypothetical protein